MQEPNSKVVSVYGDKFASRVIPAYQRTVHTRPVTFVCVVCDSQTTQERYPGKTPLYCSEECKEKRTAEKNEERVHRQREKRRALAAEKKAEKRSW